MWDRINKCIDSFHLRNHKDRSCQEKYNQQRILEVNPDLETVNTEAVEKAFALKRPQYNTYSMCKLHQMLIIHRLVKTRNPHLEEKFLQSVSKLAF